MKSPLLVPVALGASALVAGLCWADATSWTWTAKPAADASPQRTLKATLDWSYALLSEREHRVFERLSRLATPFSLEAALGTVAGEALDTDSTVAALDELAEKSLIHSRDGAYHWSEFTRVYARERLSLRAL